jgi:GNAT superfamily N-acetyltransferase
MDATTLRRHASQRQSNFKSENSDGDNRFRQFENFKTTAEVRRSEEWISSARTFSTRLNNRSRTLASFRERLRAPNALDLEAPAMMRSAPMSPEGSDSSVLHRTPSGETGRQTSQFELSGLLRKFRRNWQDYGWNITARKTLAYLIRAIYFRQVYRIYRIKLKDKAPPADSNAGQFQFRMLTPEDRDEIAQIEGIAEWMRGRLKNTIAAGQPCLAAMDGERVAGFNLIRTDRATLVLVNLTRRLRPNCAWSEHIAVKREYRQSGLGAQLRLRVFQELKRRGVRRLYGGTLVTNTASLKLARSVGFQEIADVHYRKFLSLEKWRYKRVRA